VVKTQLAGFSIRVHKHNNNKYPSSKNFLIKNKKNMFFLQVFFYICLWIVEVFSRSDVVQYAFYNIAQIFHIFEI
jgi:hypothetical protein